ncbi:MAG: tetratricopeptide repeat protein, partial [Salegentibacter sp.]
MKNLRLTLLLLLFYSSVFAFQNPNSETVEKTNEQIQNLLRDAEASVNKMDFDTALQQLNTSLELSKTIGHKRYTALTSSILAKLYAIRHDYERAKSELERAIAIQREINDQTGLAYSYINYAKIFYSTGD